MVSGTTVYPAAQEAVDYEEWIGLIAPGQTAAEVETIRRACRLAEAAHRGQKRVSGEPFLNHALAVANILVHLNLDYETIAAAILHDVVEDTDVSLEDVRREFGERIATLVDGVTKLDVIPEYRGETATAPNQTSGRTSEASRASESARGPRLHPLGATGKAAKEHAHAESLRKMLLAMAEDVRVVLIKLADRLHNLRTLSALPEDKQRRIARETMDIFAPLANRLGIWQLKWELEDLSFRYLEPADYKQIAQALAERRVDREQYLSRFVETLSTELKNAGVEAEVAGRPKHIYGIWRKMTRKRKPFEQITDIRGVRVLVANVRDCYAALGVVHGLWQHIPGEFDDYIATPKENNYRSIHTAVIGPEGKIVEVQIRTHDMHQSSELGVAAHWRYKEGRTADESFDKKIAWLRSLLAWKDELASAGEFVDQFKSEVFSERVYVFTPKGRIVDLAAGATPLDFAYAVHTDIGHRCRGAKVNGRMVPLTYKLKTGEQVEVLTVKEGGPSRDWLSPHLGYLATSKARSRVSHWFKQQNIEQAMAEGRDVLERELHRLGVSDVKFDTLAHGFGMARVDDFLAAIGHGDIKPAQLAAAVQPLIEPALKEPRPLPTSPPPRARATPPSGVTVQGIGNLLTRMARCCNPIPGEPIVGFITRGQGVTVHRRDCANAMRQREENRERLVEVDWGAQPGQTYPVEIEILAVERTGLLRDITGLLANEKINVTAVNTLTDKDAHVARMHLTIEIPDVDTLSRILALIDRIPNVTEVRRRAH